MHYRSLITQIIFAKANVFPFVATVRIFLPIVSGFSLSINFAIFNIFRAVLFPVFPIWNIPCALSDNSISYNFNQFTQLYTFGNQKFKDYKCYRQNFLYSNPYLLLCSQLEKHQCHSF